MSNIPPVTNGHYPKQSPNQSEADAGSMAGYDPNLGMKPPTVAPHPNRTVHSSNPNIHSPQVKRKASGAVDMVGGGNIA